VSELMFSFNSNISFILKEHNNKVDALSVSASIFNTEDCQGHDTYHVKTLFRPSILDNQEYLQVFENDEHVINFLTNEDPINEVDPVENQNLQEEDHKENHKPFPKKYIKLESLFMRDDQINIS